MYVSQALSAYYLMIHIDSTPAMSLPLRAPGLRFKSHAEDKLDDPPTCYDAPLYNFWLRLGEELEKTCNVGEYEDYNQGSIKLDLRLKLLMHRRRKKVARIRRKKKVFVKN